MSEDTDPNTNNLLNDSKSVDIDHDAKIFTDTEEEETKTAKVPVLKDKNLFNNDLAKSVVDDHVSEQKPNGKPIQVLAEDKPKVKSVRDKSKTNLPQKTEQPRKETQQTPEQTPATQAINDDEEFSRTVSALLNANESKLAAAMSKPVTPRPEKAARPVSR